jgi:hypothetical protein
MTTITDRLARIYASIDETIETDLLKFPPKVERSETTFEVWQDFTGDLRTEQLANQVHLAIYNVAHFPDHLRKWVGDDSVKRAQIDAFVNESTGLLLITDLSNRDKHPYPPRDGGRSRRSPEIVDLVRVMQMISGEEAGAVVFVPGQGLVKTGGGKAKVIVTATIKDGAGNVIGDLHAVLLEALTSIEVLLKELGFNETAA